MVLVSGVQQSDSFIHIYVSILFQILFPFRLLQNIEQSSLCYTVGPCWLFILNIVVCTDQSQTPNLSLPPPTFCGSLFHQLSVSFSCSSPYIFVAFSPCTFNVTIDMLGFKSTILLFVFYCSSIPTFMLLGGLINIFKSLYYFLLSIPLCNIFFMGAP